MAFMAKDWNVIVLGRWNRAILTPNGIAKRLFDLTDGKQVVVAVPLDGVSPYQVQHPHDQIMVMTDENRLIIQLLKADFISLEKAKSAGIRALKSLPETPISAAGLNLRYFSKIIDPEIVSFNDNKIDNLMSDKGIQIISRSIGRKISFGDGEINLMLSSEADGVQLSLNFHMASSNVEELIGWLSTKIEMIEEQTQNLLKLLNLTLEEVADDGNAKQ